MVMFVGGKLLHISVHIVSRPEVGDQLIRLDVVPRMILIKSQWLERIFLTRQIIDLPEIFIGIEHL